MARLAAAEGVASLVHISSIGADPAAASQYSASKGRGEEAVLAAFPKAVILRPSVIFGPEDKFFNRFAGMARLGPVLPLVGGNTRFQPVYVGDVAAAAVMGATGAAAAGVHELGGPDVDTLKGLVGKMLTVIRRRRLVLNLPFFAGSVIGTLADFGSAVTLGLIRNTLLTADQVRALKVDNVVAPKARTLADLGITPTALDAVLPEYLWRYRPSGQYAAITESAKNLRKA